MANITPQNILDIAASAGRLILENGGEIYRVEQTVSHICTSYGATCKDCYATPTAIVLSIKDENGESFSTVQRIHARSVNLERVADINDFSRKISVAPLSYQDARAQLQRIASTPPYRLPMRILASAGGASSFSLLLGGGPIAFLCGLFAGAMLCLFLEFLARFKFNAFFVNIAGGAFSALVACCLALTGIYTNWNLLALSTLMLLVPGVLFTNALRDIAAGDLVSGVSRLFEALCVAAALAAGAVVVYSILPPLHNLAFNEPVYNLLWLRLFGAFCSAASFSVLFGVRGINIFYAGFNGLLGYLAYALFLSSGKLPALFVAGLVMALFAEIAARLRRTPTTLFLVGGLIPLVPGGTLYNSFMSALGGQPMESAILLYNMALEAGAIALGIILISSLIKLVPLRKNKK